MAKPIDPRTDIFFRFAINLLIPFFLESTEGNLENARICALLVIDDYCLRTRSELMTVVRIIIYGIVELLSLGQSIGEDIPLTLALNLRNNALGLERAANRARKDLEKSLADTAPILHPPVLDPEPVEPAPQPAPTPAAAEPAETTEAQRFAAWAYAMTAAASQLATADSTAGTAAPDARASALNDLIGSLLASDPFPDQGSQTPPAEIPKAA